MAAAAWAELRPVDHFSKRVEYFLEVRGLCPRLLSAERLRTDYPAGATGWEITLPTAVGNREVDVLLPIDYPYLPASVGVRRLKSDLPHTHVMGGLMCLSDSSERHVLRSDESVLERDLDRAAMLFAQSESDAITDKGAEFINYWIENAITSPTIYTLIGEDTPFGLVAAWHGKNFIVVGPDEEILRAWMCNRLVNEEITEVRQALYLTGNALESELDSAAGLRAFVKNLGEPTMLKMLDSLAVEKPRPSAIIFRLPGAFALVGGVLCSRDYPHRSIVRKTKYPGFRRGHVPHKMLIADYFGASGQFERLPLQRADAQWVIARGGEAFDSRLRDARVCLVGIGSLGSGIARALVKAGVGSLILIDPQILRWDNVARHELGGQVVGRYKAQALADRLGADFPFAQITAKCVSWQDAYRANRALFDVDIVVSTTGDWPSECQLNTLLRHRIPPTLVYGWIEPHAAAAQSLVLTHDGGCLACGMTASGEFLSRAIDWPNDQLVREPACGASYAPYADIAASRARALITGEVLRELTTRNTLTRLVTDLYDQDLRTAGHGTLNASFLERLGHDPPEHGDRVTVPWKRRVECTACAAYASKLVTA